MSESLTLDVDILVSTETNRVLHLILIPFGFGTYYSFILNDPC